MRRMKQWMSWRERGRREGELTERVEARASSRKRGQRHERELQNSSSSLRMIGRVMLSVSFLPSHLARPC